MTPFKQVYDFKNILKAGILILIFFLITSVIINFFFDILFGSIFLGLVTLMISFNYLSSITKINLLDDGIELKSFFNSIILRYEMIREVIEPDSNNLKLLKKQYPDFTIFGKRGIYKTKQLDNLFIYSYSNKYKDNIILYYGIDYYMISVANMEVFKKNLADKLTEISQNNFK